MDPASAFTPPASLLIDSGLSVEQARLLAAAFERLELKRGEYWLEEGRVCTHLGLIETGVLQYFFFHDGEEQTTYISRAGGFVTSLRSFLRQAPSQENLKALAPTVLWTISRETLLEWVMREPWMNQFYIGMLEYQLVCVDDSRHEAITQSPEARYRKLLEQEPGVFQDAPLQLVASILGVTPQHLSRIRKKLALQKF